MNETDTSTRLFRLAIAVVGLHVADDNFIQPEAGTSAGDHLVSGLLPLALLALAAWGYPRLRGVARGGLALLLAPLAIAAGVEALHYSNQVGPSGDDFTGLITIPAGLLLAGLGAATLWRERRTTGSRSRRYGRRALLGVGALLAFSVVVFPTAVAYVTTHTARAVVPDNRLGAPYEDISFRTSDGLELEGWYVPSENGAAVISFPGRSTTGSQRRARMLARHGYGVLVFDRRGEGESDGEPNAFGWGGDRDIKAAIDYLRTRDDVDPKRIGGIGLSVGGELLLEAASEDQRLKAVVSEGAGARAYSDAMDQDEADGVQGLLYAAGAAVKTGSLALFANETPPPNLRDVVGRIAPRPIMLIAAPNTQNGEKLNRGYHEAAREPKALWELPESKHIGGMDARPEEYERRVVGFFDRALLR